EPAVRDPHLLAGEAEGPVRLTRSPGPGGERVGAGLRLAERVRADEFPAGEAGQITLLLILRAEQQQRQDAQVRLRAVGGAERGGARDLLGNDERGDAVEIEPAAGLRDVDA